MQKEDTLVNITIDGTKTNTATNKLWRGVGMISANNSSQLLLDYKAEQPQKYIEILNYLFGKNGIKITHLKIEMGADVNSSSGTEPSVKRTSEEPADVTRGAGFVLAADAKKINPDITLDMLWWGEPGWIKKVSATKQELFAARYRWYKETLDAAYKIYGLKFDYVSANQNERGVDAAWIVYLSKSLKAEKNCPYDYARIKIVAADEVCKWSIADLMLENPELLAAVDVIGSHYTSWSSDSAKKLVDEYKKEAWFSEASSPMSYAQGTYRYDKNHSGISGLNGALDIANRIITMYSGGYMTLYEYQPAVAAYYDGVNYCQKQLILADKPWCGDYLLDSGFFMALHFSQFIKKGWTVAGGACYADGKPGGDGHAIVDAKHSYLTAIDSATGDYSTVITNTTDRPIIYSFNIVNDAKKDDSVYVWETRGPDTAKDMQYDINYFKKIETIIPVRSNESSSFTVTVKPQSIVTVSTVSIVPNIFPAANKNYPLLETATRTVLSSSKQSLLTLPYTETFKLNRAKYFTDQSGAFEVHAIDRKNILMQMITNDTRGEEWGDSPKPTTNFGDDRWFNYSVSAAVKFAVQQKPAPSADDEEYVGIGLRCNFACRGTNGYWFKITMEGKWTLYRSLDELYSGTVTRFNSLQWNTISIEARGSTIKVYVNKRLVHKYVCKDDSLLSAGRAALYSSYDNNCFANISIKPEGDYYVTKYDDTDYGLTYLGRWTHNTMTGYADYKRTTSVGSQNAEVSFTFKGTGFAITGQSNDKPSLLIKVDGKIIEKKYTVPQTAAREISYYLYGLKNNEHHVEITILGETYTIDEIEIVGK